MSHNIIASIYEAKLINWAKALPAPLKVVVENEAYTPANGATYLKAFTLPADTASNTLGGDHKLYTGVFQVSIVTPSGQVPWRGLVHWPTRSPCCSRCTSGTPRVR